MATPVRLGYWKIRGLCQSVRTLLKFSGTPFTEDLFECGDAPNYFPNAWTTASKALEKEGKLDFVDLPYMYVFTVRI